MKNLKDTILEKLVINKSSKAKSINKPKKENSHDLVEWGKKYGLTFEDPSITGKALGPHYGLLFFNKQRDPYVQLTMEDDYWYDDSGYGSLKNPGIQFIFSDQFYDEYEEKYGKEFEDEIDAIDSSNYDFSKFDLYDNKYFLYTENNVKLLSEIIFNHPQLKKYINK